MLWCGLWPGQRRPALQFVTRPPAYAHRSRCCRRGIGGSARLGPAGLGWRLAVDRHCVRGVAGTSHTERHAIRRLSWGVGRYRRRVSMSSPVGRRHRRVATLLPGLLTRVDRGRTSVHAGAPGVWYAYTSSSTPLPLVSYLGIRSQPVPVTHGLLLLLRTSIHVDGWIETCTYGGAAWETEIVRSSTPHCSSSSLRPARAVRRVRRIASIVSSGRICVRPRPRMSVRMGGDGREKSGPGGNVTPSNRYVIAATVRWRSAGKPLRLPILRGW